ncbi:DUF808 domain-containing protein [Marichromatium sp. PS1]|uniref:DUF808 domain-containing protein n=1 Tax=Marichromatium sp. PS1 TaxID=3138932 RepID=UPI0032E795DE
MATSLLALLDDIASVLDDVSLLTKVAARKTASVLGDDLAVNAEQVHGLRAERELPVVWAVFKGSLRNKLILVPAALLISALAPWAIMPLLMLGGLFLCYEGFEKVAHRLHGNPKGETRETELEQALADPATDLAAVERTRIAGAIRTDFILSAEIIVITLGTVEQAGFLTQVLVLAGIALLMTIGVYGLVAAIVKLDDAGLYLSRSGGEGALASARRRLGETILRAAPRLMKGLSIVGTIAMFLVGGGILVHGLPIIGEPLHHLAEVLAGLPVLGAPLATLVPLLINALIGILAGALVLSVVEAIGRLRRA